MVFDPSHSEDPVQTGQAIQDAAQRLDSLFGSQPDAMFTTVPAQNQDPDGLSAPADDNAEPEEETTETPDDGDTEDVETPEGDDEGASGNDDQPDEPQAYLQTLSELADAHGASLEDLLQLKHHVKAAGKEREITLSEMVRGFQQGTDYQEKTTRLREKQRQLEADEQNRRQTFQAQTEALAQHFGYAQQLINQDWNSPRLQQLQHEDPTQWLIERQQIQERNAQLQQQWAQVQQQAQHHHQEMNRQHLARQHQLLMESVPAWNDTAKREVEQLARSFGFSDQEIQAAGYSANMTRALYELAQLRKNQNLQSGAKAKAKATVKKLKKTVPRIAPAGKGKVKRNGTAQTAKARAVKASRSQLKKSGKLVDAVRAIQAIDPNWGT